MKRLWSRLGVRAASVSLLLAGLVGGVYVGQTQDFEKQSAEFCLRVRDNSVGLSGAVRGAGMGHELVRALATSLGGRALIADAQPGLEVKIMFPAGPDSPSGATEPEPPSV